MADPGGRPLYVFTLLELTPREFNRRDISAVTFFSSCSQTLTTLKPNRSSSMVTILSLCLFLFSLAFQNAERVFGICPHFLQPCQKHPSTKTTIFFFEKRKSGRPGSGACNTH